MHSNTYGHTHIHIQRTLETLSRNSISLSFREQDGLTYGLYFKPNKDTLFEKVSKAYMNCKAPQKVYMIAESYVIQYSYM